MEPRDISALIEDPAQPPLGEMRVFEHLAPVESIQDPHPVRLNQLLATSICGNDITSSCLYVSAICVLHAGPYAPISLLLVAGILFLFRKIYAEVVTALPLNGGAYNVLLNTTSKRFAALAACLTLLSYIATAVISAYEAMHYAHQICNGLPILGATLCLLGLFAFLNILGISESALVATGIFLFHLTTLVLLILASSIMVMKDSSQLLSNLQHPPEGGLFKGVFFGFAAAMLGVSGFESSANFVEEQKKGVFVKTLRNMWIAVAVFNPLISFLALGLIPLTSFSQHKETLLAYMGRLSALPFLEKMVSFDAVLVLSGAVITSFVGVSGLVKRMSLDRCLPQFLLAENRWRRTHHWIFLGFFALCVSILFATQGDVEALAGVYTISFLSVMALFAVGNMLLKVKRSRLPREVKASWPSVIVAFVAVVLGIIGNITLMDSHYLHVFMGYFCLAVLGVALMLTRNSLLKALLFMAHSLIPKTYRFGQRLRAKIDEAIAMVNSLTVIYFSRGDNLANLNRAALYVLRNETLTRLEVVHIYQDQEKLPPNLRSHVEIIDIMYPDLIVDLILVKGEFGPSLISAISEQLKVAKNYMFIGTPGETFPHDLSEFGGVRLIL